MTTAVTTQSLTPHQPLLSLFRSNCCPHLCLYRHSCPNRATFSTQDPLIAMPRRSPRLLAAAGNVTKKTPRPGPSRRQVQKPVQPPGPLDALPVEIIMHILQFDDLKHVFRSMRVCRTWEKAARAEIIRREELQIISLGDVKIKEDENDVSHEKIRQLAATFRAGLLKRMSPLDVIVCREPVPDSLFQSLTGNEKKQGMENLKVLFYCSYGAHQEYSLQWMEHREMWSWNSRAGRDYFYDNTELDVQTARDNEIDDVRTQAERIIPLVLNNSATLQVLDTTCDLPLDWYPKLRQLGCRELHADAAAAAPRLSHLAVWEAIPAQVIHTLDPDKMQSLHIYYKWEGESLKPLVQGMHRLVKLKVFSLEIFRGEECQNDFVEVAQDYERMFDYCRLLEEVSLVFDCRDGNVLYEDAYKQEVVIRLAERNPHLKRLVLGEFELEDESVNALAQLQQLSYIDLDGCFGSINTDGIIRLLKGRSRHQLRTVALASLSDADLDVSAINERIDRIAEETGRFICRWKVSTREVDVKFV